MYISFYFLYFVLFTRFFHLSTFKSLQSFHVSFFSLSLFLSISHSLSLSLHLSISFSIFTPYCVSMGVFVLVFSITLNLMWTSQYFIHTRVRQKVRYYSRKSLSLGNWEILWINFSLFSSWLDECWKLIILVIMRSTF